MDINDDIMNMPRGWIIHYKNGQILTEYDRDGTQRDWRKAAKVGIRSISLKWFTKHWTITGKGIYLQKKRGWIIPVAGLDQAPNIQYRYIGYWEGNDKIYYRVDELTGQMKMVIESIGEGTGK